MISARGASRKPLKAALGGAFARVAQFTIRLLSDSLNHASDGSDHTFEL